jgi:uncharacterized membrane protein (DUF4010 family)
MYARFLVLIAFFNRDLAFMLAPGFAIAAAVGMLGGVFVSSMGDGPDGDGTVVEPNTNPLQIKAAVLFAIVFVALLVVTQVVRESLGRPGVYTLAGIVGVTDVDPFILGVAQSHGMVLSLHAAAVSIIIAASSNNLAKAAYAVGFADRSTGRRAAILLVGLAVIGLVGLAWV